MPLYTMAGLPVSGPNCVHRLWSFMRPRRDDQPLHLIYPHGRAYMEHQLATALAGLTTGIYVLTVRVDECQHGMSSSWATQVSGTPVLIMAAVDQQHVTHQMVVQSGVFALNIVGTQSKHLEDYFYSAQSR